MVESDPEGSEIITCPRHVVFNFLLLVKDKRKFTLGEKERTKANIRWVKSTKGKGIFRLWTESGWRYTLVGAEMGKVFLTVWMVLKNVLITRTIYRNLYIQMFSNFLFFLKFLACNAPVKC